MTFRSGSGIAIHPPNAATTRSERAAPSKKWTGNAPPHTALIEACLGLNLFPNATLGVSYSGQLALNHLTDNAVKGRFTWLFSQRAPILFRSLYYG
jgi:hypothetical protein